MNIEQRFRFHGLRLFEIIQKSSISKFLLRSTSDLIICQRFKTIKNVLKFQTKSASAFMACAYLKSSKRVL